MAERELSAEEIVRANAAAKYLLSMIGEAMGKAGDISSPLSHWYAGVTNDFDRRCSEHKLTNDDLRFKKETVSDTVAKEAERILTSRPNELRGGGPAPEGSDIVYVYKMASHTDP